MDAESEKLIRDVKGLVRDAEDLIKATSGNVGEQAREARAKLAGALVVARETCNRLEGHAQRNTVKADHLVRGHPYEAILSALGVGVLLGLTIGRILHPR